MRGKRGRQLALLLFLATGGLVVAAGTEAGAAAMSEKKDKKDKGPGKAVKDLHKAYEGITDLAQAPVAGKEAARAFDHAKRFYRDAVKAYPDEPRRAAEMAVAANDAVRGLEHLRRATARPIPGLPEPPADPDGPPAGPKGKGPPPPDRGPAADPGPWGESLDALTAARERLARSDEDSPVAGPARDFLDAAKSVYSQARTAYEAGDYRKAAEFARAAEAWTHVPEHLTRAGGDAAPPPAPPEPRGKRPGVPPPPPPVKD